MNTMTLQEAKSRAYMGDKVYINGVEKTYRQLLAIHNKLIEKNGFGADKVYKVNESTTIGAINCFNLTR